MKNIVELRGELIKVFERLDNGSLDKGTAMEMTNAAGKIINTVKVQLEYAGMRKEEPVIAFLEGTTEENEHD